MPCRMMVASIICGVSELHHHREFTLAIENCSYQVAGEVEGCIDPHVRRFRYHRVIYLHRKVESRANDNDESALIGHWLEFPQH